MTRVKMNWKIILFIIFIGIIVALIYHRKTMHTNYFSEEPVAILEADSLFKRFQNNAVNNLLNEVVQINGKVTGFDPPFIILNNNLICSPETGVKLPVVLGDSVTVKGRCVSFDDLLSELRIDHVSIVHHLE
tara:strand:+ start:271 stop:666 length:396 start_codon:yes stop_codon:yes gene_type:complete